MSPTDGTSGTSFWTTEIGANSSTRPTNGTTDVTFESAVVPLRTTSGPANGTVCYSL